MRRLTFFPLFLLTAIYLPVIGSSRSHHTGGETGSGGSSYQGDAPFDALCGIHPQGPSAHGSFREYRHIPLMIHLDGHSLRGDAAAQRTRGPEQRPRRSSSVEEDSVYNLSAGSSSLKDTLGERVLELRDGVEIIHGNVTITGRRGFQYTKRRLTYLIGDVTIDQEDLHMEGDEAEYRRDIDRAILSRNVRIVDRGWEVTCDRVVFHRTKGTVWLLGNVVAFDSATTIAADSIFYDRERLVAEAFDHVVVTNLKEGFTAEGDHGFYFRDTREGLLDRNPHLIVDPRSPEPATITSDTMRFFPDSRRATSYGRVKIIKGSTVTQCDSAAVFDEEKRAELYGEPLAKQENVSMAGTTMALHYSDEEVEAIRISGDAFIHEEQTDTLVIGRDSWIRGDTILLYLEDNRVDSIRVLHHCRSTYYPRAEKRVESNFARGDSMFFRFEMDTLTYVRIHGGADGAYRFLDVAEGETVDSLRAIADTSLQYVSFSEKSERVAYAAERIEYFAQTRDIVLDGDAKVDYQDRTLFGENIVYRSKLQLLDATGSPVLVEGNEKFYGDRMDYDLESKVGLVKDGSTKFMEGYYFGEQVAKVGDNILKVWNSTYTTCDLSEPHYHFASREMKVFLKDKVVSGPIWLYIGDTPIFYLPFLANNIRKGRRSGVLRPEFEFGITKRTGRFIRNFGYYWATNDYTDFTVLGDFNEDASFRFFIKNRYKLRYRLSGGVDFSFYRDLTNFRNEWTITSNHSQTLGEKFTFTSDLRFVSSDAAPRAISRIDQVADVINRRIESNVSLRKSWKSIGLSASAKRVQKLNITDPNAVRVQTTLPSIALSIPSRNLYFGKETKKGEKSFLEILLGGIRYSPGVSARRTTEEREYVSREVLSNSLSLNFSSPRRIGFITVSPSLSMSNDYTRTTEEVKAHAEDETTFVDASRTVTDDNDFRWSTGASANTNLFGTFYPEIGPLVGIRHTISPSASYSYRPAVGSRPSSQSLSVALRNSIDLKVRDGEEERPLNNVLIWSLSSSYNPDAPKRKRWGTISSLVNLRLFSASISMSQSIEPYDLDVLSTQITSSVSLSGTHRFGSSKEAAERDLNIIASDTTGGTSVIIESPEGEPGKPSQPRREGLSWNLSLTFSYSKPRFGEPRSTLGASGGIQLTKNWRISYSTTYDVEDRELLMQNYSIYRDLHCWEMAFSRQKLGEEWQYYFKINVKAHSEIFAESGRRGLGTGGIPFGY